MGKEPLRTINRLLIANRGEIACRIIKTAKKMGIETFAIASIEDKNALYTTLADHVLHLKGDAVQSYLDQAQILDLAKKHNVDAIHPGYGFLSENPRFAEGCEKADILFVGPSAKAIDMMGLKDAAKKHAEKGGVKTVPGYYGDDQRDEIFCTKAKEAGYPMLIKPIAGGGGKGMRICRNETELLEALPAARREAKTSFGDDRLLIEKYIENPRHIEVQILFDKHGHGVYLFERDCTLQRRHQKVIEEAPSHLSEDLRKRVGNMALDAGKAVNYSNAGTVECLFDPETEELYFMEMNTRLQVEHPVSEEITGVDLVEQQFHIAAGKKLPFTQNDLKINGHALEVRLYAEDAAQNFLPQTGKLLHLAFPSLPFLRVDTGVRTGDSISMYYDPMIAKMITRGSNRDEAIAHMLEALEKTKVLGLKTNLSFLKSLLIHEKVKQNRYATHFIENHLDELLAKNHDDNLYPLFACALNLKSRKSNNDPFMLGDRFRINAPSIEKCHFTYQDTPLHCELHYDHENIVYTHQDETYVIHKVTQKDFTYTLQTDKGTFTFEGAQKNGKIRLNYKGHEVLLTKGALAAENVGNEKDHQTKILKAPMHGKVVKIFAQKGEKASKNTTLMVMEAMKMEHLIKAPFDGILTDIHTKEGATLEEGKELITITPKKAS